MTKTKSRTTVEHKPAHKPEPKSKAGAHTHTSTEHPHAAAPGFGRFCWNELMVHDLARAKAFYSQSLGWQFEPMPLADGRTYWIIKVPGQPDPVGGIFEMIEPAHKGMPEQWVPYVAVDDVDQRLKTSVAAGAVVCMEPIDIAGVGRMAALRQPGGAMIYWMKPHMRG